MFLYASMQDRTDHYRALVDTCIEAGANIIRILTGEAEAHTQARTAEPEASPTQAPTPLPDIAAAYTQVHCAVRLAILLAQSLDQPPKPTRAAATPPPAPAPSKTPSSARPSPPRPPASTPNCANASTTKLQPRRSHPPAGEIIKDIIRDLGFDRICGTHPYKRRTPSDLALLQAAAPQGQAANPAHTPTWRPFPPNKDEDLPPILQTILNPTRFRGK